MSPPHYVNAGRGRRPLPLETMPRVYFLQQWFDLSDQQAEDMLYDSESMRRFARVELQKGYGARRVEEPALPARAGAAPADVPDLRRRARSPRRAAAVPQRGHERRRDGHRGAQLDEERDKIA